MKTFTNYPPYSDETTRTHNSHLNISEREHSGNRDRWISISQRLAGSTEPASEKSYLEK